MSAGWGTKSYVGFRIVAADEDDLLMRVNDLLDPLATVKRDAEYHRGQGVSVEDVVIEINGKREVLTFDEFEARFCL